MAKKSQSQPRTEAHNPRASVSELSQDMYVGINDRHAYVFETVDREQRDTIADLKPARLRELNPWPVPGTSWRIVAHGSNNLLPQYIRDIITKAHLPGGIFKKILFLNWGQGPHLYQMDFTDGKPKRKWLEDADIMAWLESWDYETYLRKAATDFNHMEAVYSKVFLNRGQRIGKPAQVAKLEHVSAGDCRYEFPEDYETPLGIITANWEFPFLGPVRRYPRLEKAKPLKYELSILDSQLHSFLERYYSKPSYTGALPWMANSSKVPVGISSLMNNAAIVKFHVKVPKKYWDDARSALTKQFEAEGKKFTDDDFKKYKDQFFVQLTSVMSGVDNAGKFFTSDTIVDTAGNIQGWEILPIDQKISDYVTAMKDINTMANAATIQGIGLHQALANVSSDGKSDSGSEQLYAEKLYKNTQIRIPEDVVCEAINLALKVNFPQKKIKIGFYHEAVEREQDVTSKNRIVNN